MNLSSSSKLWLVVPAAGVGSRMGAAQPKQYLSILGQPILATTLNKLLRLPQLHRLVLVVAQGDEQHLDLVPPAAPVVICRGGASRAQSVRNGLQSIVDGGGQNDWVLVHDAARPCVQLSRVEALIQACLQSNCGGILAAPVADTLKQAAIEPFKSPNASFAQAEKTVDRSQLWQAHTPQMFPVANLIAALDFCFESGVEVTDEASAVEAQGQSVLLVEDARDNIKVTRPEDLALAEFILSRQQS